MGMINHAPSHKTTRHQGCGGAGSSSFTPRNFFDQGIAPAAASKMKSAVAVFSPIRIQGGIPRSVLGSAAGRFDECTGLGHSQLKRYDDAAYRTSSGPLRPSLYGPIQPNPSTSNPKSST